MNIKKRQIPLYIQVLNDKRFKNRHEQIRKELEKFIPKGDYCYVYKKYVCPFWSININKPHQMNGFCKFLQRGDWQDKGIGLIWDSCKECGIKEDGEFKGLDL